MIPRGGFAVGGSVKFVEPCIGLLDCGKIEECHRVIRDPWEQASAENVARHLSFELAVADEHDDGVKVVIGKAEEQFESLYMQRILVKRVLKPMLRLVDLLSPLGLFLVAENPAFVVLRFDHKDPELGDDDVINLGGSLAVGARQVDVAEGSVEGRIESLECHASYHAFAQPALERRTTCEFQEQP